LTAEFASDPLPTGTLFVVFFFLGYGGGVVFDWEWRYPDPDDPRLPVGWSDCFTRKLWP